MEKIILITGTSSGIGFHTAILLAKSGHRVYATMRDLAKNNELLEISLNHKLPLKVLRLDVTDENSIKDCVENIVQVEGKLDVLINNAGSGFVRPMEQASIAEIQEVMDINFYGPIRCMQGVLPSMRKQRSGHIINVSSVGGLVGQPLNEIYCAAKFALEGLTESMATYMQPYFGINLSLIEPGGVITEFSNTVVRNLEASGGIRNDDYEPVFNDYMNYRSGFTDEVKAKVFQTPEQVAEVILQCISDANPHLRYITSEGAKTFTYLKSGLDVTGEILQKTVRKNILDK